MDKKVVVSLIMLNVCFMQFIGILTEENNSATGFGFAISQNIDCESCSKTTSILLSHCFKNGFEIGYEKASIEDSDIASSGIQFAYHFKNDGPNLSLGYFQGEIEQESFSLIDVEGLSLTLYSDHGMYFGFLKNKLTSDYYAGEIDDESVKIGKMANLSESIFLGIQYTLNLDNNIEEGNIGLGFGFKL